MPAVLEAYAGNGGNGRSTSVRYDRQAAILTQLPLNRLERVSESCVHIMESGELTLLLILWQHRMKLAA